MLHKIKWSYSGISFNYTKLNFVATIVYKSCQGAIAEAIPGDIHFQTKQSKVIRAVPLKRPSPSVKKNQGGPGGGGSVCQGKNGGGVKDVLQIWAGVHFFS